MGQYYKYLVIGNDTHIGNPYAYDNGAKLMEHSYVGNNYVKSALDLIYCNPCQVAWVGDYSEDGSCVGNEKSDDFNTYYHKVWGKYDSELDDYSIKPFDVDEAMADEDMIQYSVEDCPYYLINHTKKIFVDVAKYVAQNKWHEEYDWQGEHHEYYMCIDLLPLLTACGNGQGGGDYGGDNESDVGSWALDLIELIDDKENIPTDYIEETYSFTER